MSRSIDPPAKKSSIGNGEVPLGRETRISVELLNPEIHTAKIDGRVFDLKGELRVAGLRSLGKEKVDRMEVFYEERAAEILDRLLAIRTAKKKFR